MAKPIDEKTRYTMRQHQIAPERLSQADVMRQLGLIDVNAFYRLFYRVNMERQHNKGLSKSKTNKNAVSNSKGIEEAS